MVLALVSDTLYHEQRRLRRSRSRRWPGGVDARERSFYQQIASELYLSVDAVKAHLRTLFGYFGVEHLPQNQKRSYLAMRALQDGVVARRDL